MAVKETHPRFAKRKALNNLAPFQARNVLLRLVVGSSVVIVGALAYLGYQIVRTIALENLKENAFLEVQQGVNEIDQWLIARKAEVETLANTPVVRRIDVATIDPYIQRLATHQADFFKYALGFTDGTYYNSARRDLAEGSIGDRIYFQQALAGHQFVSDPIISRSTGVHQVNIASPIWPMETQESPSNPSPKKPHGVFIGSVSVERVTTVVNQLQYGAGSYPFALNSEGKAISHPNASLMSTKEKPARSFLSSAAPDLAAIAQQMVNKQQGIDLRPIDNELKYVAYLPLQEANWSVALVIPRHNIERQLRPLDAIALVVLALSLTMIVLLWQVQSFEQKQLKQTQAAAEMANQAKSEFLANMSHELRTPLNGILGYTQILRREQDINPQQKQGLAIIHQSGEHLLMLINDILDIAKIEAHRFKLQPHDVPLPAVLRMLVNVMQAQATQKELNFIYVPSPHLPQIVSVDEKRLQQVLMNLLNNAIKFTEQGTVTFTVEVRQLPNEGLLPREKLPNTCQLYFEVTDTGIGMAPTALDQIFQPFEQRDLATQLSKQPEGTGLGLAISQQIVHLMNSKILAKSRLGEGSTFSFSLELPVIQSSDGTSRINR